MPPSVITAVALLAGFAGLSVWSGAHAGRFPLLAVALQALILFGLVRRDRLAWQWGRIVPLLFAAFTLVMVLTARGPAPAAFVAVPLLLFVPALAITVSLGRPSARAWFRLVCPACGGDGTRPRDVLFRRARCLRCGNVW